MRLQSSLMMVMMTIMESNLTFQANDVRALTGLTPSQLREWTSRRGIVLADRPARGRGQHAQYTWNTVLVLRILAELHRSFGIEIAAWAELGTKLRDSLSKSSPISLYGKYLLIFDGHFEITLTPPANVGTTAIVVRLDPHLEVLATGLGVPPPAKQMNLFAAVRV
jgi:DNA-binding transcriptional MerR regulator